MTFTITYRDASGAMREESVEAANRAEALAAMKARGISPISLRGGNPGGSQSLAAADAPSRGRGGARPSKKIAPLPLANAKTAIAALAALTLALGAWLYFSRRPATPVAPPSSPRTTTSSKNSPINHPKPAQSENLNKTTKSPVPPPAMTNSAGIPLSPNGKPLWTHPRRYSKYGVTTSHLDLARMDLESRTFPNYADRCLAYLVNTIPGEEAGSIDYANFMSQFKKSFDAQIEILPDDSEEVRDMKESVIELKAELKKRHESGEDILKILSDVQQELSSIGGYRKELEKQLNELANDPATTDADLETYVKAANDMLSKKGALGLKMPLKRRIERKVKESRALRGR